MKTQSTFTTMPAAARFAIVLFAITGLAAVAYAMIFQMGFAPVRLFLLMAAATLCAQAKVKLYKASTISLLTSVVLLAVISEGLGSALIVAVFGVTVQTVVPSKKLVLHQLAFNLGMITLTVTATWFTHQSLTGARIATPLSTEALATLMAARLAADKTCGVHSVHTFGSPRVGDRDFARNYELALGHCTYRIVNAEDLVTRVPPRVIPGKEWHYDHVGQVVFFDSDGQMQISAGFWERFLNTVINAVQDFRNEIKTAINDHSMELYVRLLKRVTPDNK